MTYGYARVSRPSQSIDRQVRNIKAFAPDAVIVKEAFTGAVTSRPEWDRLRRRLKAGDVVVFDSVSRMSRNAAEGLALYEALFTGGVELVFLKERHIDTASYKEAMNDVVALPEVDAATAEGEMIGAILSALNRYALRKARADIERAFEQSEKELSDLRQRTKEGIETAQLKGKRIGIEKGRRLTTKKSVAAKAVILKHSKAFGGALSDGECMKLAGVSRNSYYKYKAELRIHLNTC